MIFVQVRSFIFSKIQKINFSTENIYATSIYNRNCSIAGCRKSSLLISENKQSINIMILTIQCRSFYGSNSHTITDTSLMDHNLGTISYGPMHDYGHIDCNDQPIKSLSMQSGFRWTFWQFWENQRIDQKSSFKHAFIPGQQGFEPGIFC